MLRVLEGIDFTLEAGRTVGVVGPSGSGKTTLGRIVAGVDRPDEGAVRYRGQLLAQLSGNEWKTFRRRVQMLFQDPEGALNPAKTVARAFNEVGRLAGMSHAETGVRIRELLDTVHLSPEVLSRVPSRLSGGQNQRVALARILLLDPEGIVLDEPTSALDVSVQAEILRLLKELQCMRGLSYLFISHDPRVIEFMCDSVASLG